MEQNTEQTSLNELAVEVYGNQYVSDPREELPTESRALTVDDAYDRLQESKDELPAETESRDEAYEPEVQATEQVESDAVWSTADVETISVFRQAATQFENDLAVFAQAKAVDLNALEKQDRAKAVALRTQIKMTEDELRQRHAVLSQVAEGLGQKLTGTSAKQAQKRLREERAKLEEAIPDGLDTAQLRKYLRERGFSAAELDRAADHRLVALAEKARRWDNHVKKPGKIPTKGKKKPTEPPELRAAKAQARDGRGLRENASILARGTSPSKTQPNVEQLRKKMKQTGSIDDAYNYLQARKRAG